MAHDPQQIKNTASSFLSAADRCLERRQLPSGQYQMPIVPAIVCTAFGIELCLKAIITIEKGKATGHELLKLFIKLSPQSKSILARTLALDEKVIRQRVGSISSAFVDWRYVYEKDSSHIDLAFLRDFSKATWQLLELLSDPTVDSNTA
jgi:hypothetical protein